MDFKEILVIEEIDKVFVSSIPRTDGFRRFFSSYGERQIGSCALWNK